MAIDLWYKAAISNSQGKRFCFSKHKRVSDCHSTRRSDSFLIFARVIKFTSKKVSV